MDLTPLVGTLESSVSAKAAAASSADRKRKGAGTGLSSVDTGGENTCGDFL